MWNGSGGGVEGAGAVNDSIHTFFFFFVWRQLLELGKSLGGLFSFFLFFSFHFSFFSLFLTLVFFFFFFTGCVRWFVLLASAGHGNCE